MSKTGFLEEYLGVTVDSGTVTVTMSKESFLLAEGKIQELRSDLDKARADLERANKWHLIMSSDMPAPYEPVALINMERFQNCGFERNVQDVGYLQTMGDIQYWAIRGERATEISAYTHWKRLEPPTINPDPAP